MDANVYSVGVLNNQNPMDIIKDALTHTIAKADTTTAVEEDELYSEEIQPKFSIAELKSLSQWSNIIPQCADAYASNIAGFGYKISYIEDTEDTQNSENEETPEKREEWDKAVEIVENLCADVDFTEVLADAIKEREQVGIAYLECVRDSMGMGNVIKVSPIRDTSSVTILVRDDKFTEYTYYYRGKKKTDQKQFRRFKQQMNGKIVYYKEFGDPRLMNRHTGKYETRLKVPDRANELIPLRVGNEPYGKVRWLGQILGVDGSAAAENLNNSYFHKGRHTPLMLLVSGGNLTEKSRKEIQDYLGGVTGANAAFKWLIVEADTKPGVVGMEDTQKPTVEVKDLSPMLQQDALFQDYIDKNRRKIQSAFRLPDVYVAYTTDYNKATVYACIKLTDEQVFARERRRLNAIINKQILNSYGFKHIQVELRGPDLIDPDVKVAMMNFARNAGGVSMNMGKEVFYEAIGKHNCEDFGLFGKYPIQMILPLVQDLMPELLGIKLANVAEEPAITQDGDYVIDNASVQQLNEIAQTAKSAYELAEQGKAEDEVIQFFKMLKEKAEKELGDEQTTANH